MDNNGNKLNHSRHNGQNQHRIFTNKDIVNKFVKLLSGALFMSIYKEYSPTINNCRASSNCVEHIEGNNFNYTQNSKITQAQIVTAFSLSIHKSILIYVLDNNDKCVVIYWIAKSINQKVRKFGLIWNKFQSDSDINLDNIITDYQITSE